jgi:hypothetical protein
MGIRGRENQSSIFSTNCAPVIVDDPGCHTTCAPPSCAPDPTCASSNCNSNSNDNSNDNSNYNSNCNVSSTQVDVCVNVDVSACVNASDPSNTYNQDQQYAHQYDHQFDHQYDHQFDHGLDLSSLNFTTAGAAVLAPDVVDQSSATTAFNLDQINNLQDNDTSGASTVTGGCLDACTGGQLGGEGASVDLGCFHIDGLGGDPASISQGANGTVTVDASVSAFNQSIVLGANVQYNTANMIGGNDSHQSYDHTGDVHLPG